MGGGGYVPWIIEIIRSFVDGRTIKESLSCFAEEDFPQLRKKSFEAQNYISILAFIDEKLMAQWRARYHLTYEAKQLKSN